MPASADSGKCHACPMQPSMRDVVSALTGLVTCGGEWSPSSRQGLLGEAANRRGQGGFEEPVS